MDDNLPSFLQCLLDELYLDIDCLFDLVLSHPEFEGLISNELSHSAAVAEAMRVLHTVPAPKVLLSSHWDSMHAEKRKKEDSFVQNNTGKQLPSLDAFCLSQPEEPIHGFLLHSSG